MGFITTCPYTQKSGMIRWFSRAHSVALYLDGAKGVPVTDCLQLVDEIVNLVVLLPFLPPSDVVSEMVHKAACGGRAKPGLVDASGVLSVSGLWKSSAPC